eukprot:237497-Prymnesium_polylepis.2
MIYEGDCRSIPGLGEAREQLYHITRSVPTALHRARGRKLCAARHARVNASDRTPSGPWPAGATCKPLVGEVRRAADAVCVGACASAHVRCPQDLLRELIH